MAAAVAPYDEWLSNKLLSFNEDIDAEIFVSYIVGILDEDASSDEKRQSLVEFLGGIMETDQERACEEIMAEWERTHAPSVAPDNGAVKDMGDRLAELMISQQLPTMKERQMTEEEKARKAAILAQYAEVSEGESDDEDTEAGGAKAGAAAPAVAAAAPGGASAGASGGASSSGSGGRGTLTDGNLLMFKNTNASDVKHREQEQREKSKQEAEKKKEKDKADREAQRQKQQERKEAEKKRTQKGERRR